MSTEVSTTLREILAEVTEVDDPYRLGPDDDLFAHGLTSLELVRVLVHLEDRFGVQVPDDLMTQDLFRSLRSLEGAVTRLQAYALDRPAGHG
jgi:acyl carrier protein